MSDGEENKITSNNFGDFIIEYNNNINILNQLNIKDYIIINERFALAMIPLAEITEETYKKFKWGSIPLCYGLMDTSSLEASGVQKVQNIPALALTGKGVLVGIMDTGIEYTNQVFRYADNTTKILNIWDQTIDTANQYPANIPYGTEYTKDQINLALKSDNPLELVPTTDEIGHGTALAGVAAGARVEAANFSGVVPDAELIVVKLKQAKPLVRELMLIPMDAVCYQENDIMFGLRYLMETAIRLKRPIAICIGLGSSSGAHSGKGALNDYAFFLSDTPGSAIVTAAGNEGNSGGHYFGTIDSSVGFDTVELKVGKDVKGFIAELWGFPPNTYSVDILSPSGEYVPRIPARLGESREIKFLFDNTVIHLDYQTIEPESSLELILLRFQSPAEGIWRFRVYGTGSQFMNFHMWLPIQNFLGKDTFFIKPNPETTITSPGNNYTPITATAYDHTTKNLYLNASRGYTTEGLIKPDFAAPGVNVYSPGLNNTFTNSTGTSVAAANVAGVAAMLLEWGIIKEKSPNMNTSEIKSLLIRGTQRDPNVTYPNKEWGFGILDIYNTFLTFRGE